MHRNAVLGAIVAIGTISITVSASRAQQQGPTPGGLSGTRIEPDKPVTTISNTHTHGDHTGSNEFFGSAARRMEEALSRMR